MPHLYLGVKFSLKEKEVLRYVVIAASSDYKTGSYALEGKFFGTKASASVGAGIGAQFLIGGFEESFSLQPISVGEVKGVRANIGLGYLNLQKDPRK